MPLLFSAKPRTDKVTAVFKGIKIKLDAVKRRLSEQWDAADDTTIWNAALKELYNDERATVDDEHVADCRSQEVINMYAVDCVYNTSLLTSCVQYHPSLERYADWSRNGDNVWILAYVVDGVILARSIIYWSSTTQTYILVRAYSSIDSTEMIDGMRDAVAAHFGVRLDQVRYAYGTRACRDDIIHLVASKDFDNDTQIPYLDTFEYGYVDNNDNDIFLTFRDNVDSDTEYVCNLFQNSSHPHYVTIGEAIDRMNNSGYDDEDGDWVTTIYGERISSDEAIWVESRDGYVYYEQAVYLEEDDLYYHEDDTWYSAHTGQSYSNDTSSVTLYDSDSSENCQIPDHLAHEFTMLFHYYHGTYGPTLDVKRIARITSPSGTLSALQSAYGRDIGRIVYAALYDVYDEDFLGNDPSVFLVPVQDDDRASMWSRNFGMVHAHATYMDTGVNVYPYNGYATFTEFCDAYIAAVKYHAGNEPTLAEGVFTMSVYTILRDSQDDTHNVLLPIMINPTHKDIENFLLKHYGLARVNFDCRLHEAGQYLCHVDAINTTPDHPTLFDIKPLPYDVWYDRLLSNLGV